MRHSRAFGIAAFGMACTLLVAFMVRQGAVSHARSQPLAWAAANVGGSCYTVIPIPLARPGEARDIPIPLARPGEAQVIPIPPACIIATRRPSRSLVLPGVTSSSTLGLPPRSPHGVAAPTIVAPGHSR